jgi:hypothetical protein
MLQKPLLAFVFVVLLAACTTPAQVTSPPPRPTRNATVNLGSQSKTSPGKQGTTTTKSSAMPWWAGDPLWRIRLCKSIDLPVGLFAFGSDGSISWSKDGADPWMTIALTNQQAWLRDNPKKPAWKAPFKKEKGTQAREHDCYVRLSKNFPSVKAENWNTGGNKYPFAGQEGISVRFTHCPMPYCGVNTPVAGTFIYEVTRDDAWRLVFQSGPGGSLETAWGIDSPNAWGPNPPERIVPFPYRITSEQPGL